MTIAWFVGAAINGDQTERFVKRRHLGKLNVNWQFIDPIKEWYFFTSRLTIWKVDEERIGCIKI